jgi:hypothetical protein
MGIFSGLFGNKEDKELKAVFHKIHQILDDEETQLDLIHPSMKQIIKTCPAYDKNPDGTGSFGFSETNAIPVNGPIGELAYLSRLETLQGERILFHRVGAIDRIDVFEAVTITGSAWFFMFLDFYHPRRSRVAPEGFRFTKDAPLFTGFHNLCNNFPYDFADKKHEERETGLSLAYIPISMVEPYIAENVYKRPLAHTIKLDLMKNRRTTFK